MKIICFNFIFIVFMILLCSDGGKAREKRQATESKKCILLRKCEPFLSMLRNKIPGIRRRIQKSICGWTKYRVMVRCPISAPKNEYFPSECGNMPRTAYKIINGEKTLMGEFPWAVALGYTKPRESGIDFICSGSLINKRYVLTAAHCMDPKRIGDSRTLTHIRIGDWNLSSEVDCVDTHLGKKCAPMYINAKPEKMISHPMYDKEADLADDIALIRLDRTIDFLKADGYILPICLPPFGINPRSLVNGDRNLTVIGWGNTGKRKPSEILLKGDIPFAEDKKCKSYYYSNFISRQICAGGTKVDSCQGDSGSPLMLAGPEGPPFLQVGIVSFGQICGAPDVPAVYTSVSLYKLWIKNNMEPWNE